MDPSQSLPETAQLVGRVNARGATQRFKHLPGGVLIGPNCNRRLTVAMHMYGDADPEIHYDLYDLLLGTGVARNPVERGSVESEEAFGQLCQAWLAGEGSLSDCPRKVEQNINRVLQEINEAARLARLERIDDGSDLRNCQLIGSREQRSIYLNYVEDACVYYDLEDESAPSRDFDNAVERGTVAGSEELLQLCRAWLNDEHPLSACPRRVEWSAGNSS